MIVRIMGEGQFRVTGDVEDKVNAVDNRLVEIVAQGDQKSFNAVFTELLETIRSHCAPLEDEELLESDVVLPPDDTTFEEARHLFLGEGILPG